MNWKTLVLWSFDLAKVELQVMMGNVMGTTVMNTRSLWTHGLFELDADGRKRLLLSSGLQLAALTSHGGVFAGTLAVANIFSYCMHCLSLCI